MKWWHRRGRAAGSNRVVSTGWGMAASSNSSLSGSSVSSGKSSRLKLDAALRSNNNNHNNNNNNNRKYRLLMFLMIMIKWSMPLLASDKLFLYYLVLDQHVYYKHASSSASLMCMWMQRNSMLLFGFNGKLKHHNV